MASFFEQAFFYLLILSRSISDRSISDHHLILARHLIARHSCDVTFNHFDLSGVNRVVIFTNQHAEYDDFHHFTLNLTQYTLKKSYKRPPHILSSSSESKIRSIKIHDHMNKPMSNSGSVSFCIPKCVILLTQTKHV